MDLLQREGHYPVPPQAPSTLGVEFSGTVESLGEGCKDGFKQGDEVFGLAYGGAYAEYIAVNTHMLLHKPSHLSWEEAAGVPEVSCFVGDLEGVLTDDRLGSLPPKQCILLANLQRGRAYCGMPEHQVSPSPGSSYPRLVEQAQST